VSRGSVFVTSKSLEKVECVWCGFEVIVDDEVLVLLDSCLRLKGTVRKGRVFVTSKLLEKVELVECV